MNGIIQKNIGGNYHIITNDGVVICTARGKFRMSNMSPVAGDNVKIEKNSETKGVITEIMSRKNSLVRPACSNIDVLIIVASMAPPITDLLFIDNLTAIAEHKKIKPVVVINKSDINKGLEFEKIYKSASIDTLVMSATEKTGTEELKEKIKGKLSVVAGNSGVGKTSILNALGISLLKTGDISEKIGRGRHTTRVTELISLPFGGFIADTPGFSSFDVKMMEMPKKNELEYCFKEFSSYLGKCKFNDCSHQKETGCAIIEAVKNGEIQKSRHENYCKIYELVKEFKEWN